MEYTLRVWLAILLVRAKAALIGLSMLLCTIIHDDRRDPTARVVALRSGGDHDD